MEIGGFQVQPTLRPEDVVVAGIEPVWLVVLVVVVNEVEMIRKSKFDARCVFVLTFISLFQYYTHLHVHQGDERYCYRRDPQNVPAQICGPQLSLEIHGNTPPEFGIIWVYHREG